MTTFEKRINDDLKNAMKAKEKGKMRAIRAIKSAILLAKTDGSGEEVTEGKAMKMLTKMAKQRKDSLKIFVEQGREDLAVVEREELEVIAGYLPKAMTTEEIEAGVKAIIEKVGASSMRDMGKVMGIASKQFMGKADGKAISAIVKNLLK
ncbi:MAG: GatB/YqeY domain-containing protein [Saprospiraceae bacterium]